MRQYYDYLDYIFVHKLSNWSFATFRAHLSISTHFLLLPCKDSQLLQFYCISCSVFRFGNLIFSHTTDRLPIPYHKLQKTEEQPRLKLPCRLLLQPTTTPISQKQDP